MVSQCSNCPLNQAPYDPGQSVPGIGYSDAGVFLVGEGPGKNEAEAGVPFIGQAGDCLQDCMVDAGYGEGDFFITNVVKHRPPKNRDPTPQEREACRPWLIKQLVAVDPKVVVAIGKQASFALAEISGEEIPSKGLRGHTFKLKHQDKEWPVICTWHPSYVLRSRHKPQVREQLVSDLAAAYALAEVRDDYSANRQDSDSDRILG